MCQWLWIFKVSSGKTKDVLGCDLSHVLEGVACYGEDYKSVCDFEVTISFVSYIFSVVCGGVGCLVEVCVCSLMVGRGFVTDLKVL